MVSIHAPARGATQYGKLAMTTSVVSIHAPARGATEFEAIKRVSKWFQSTRPRGARQGIR